MAAMGLELPTSGVPTHPASAAFCQGQSLPNKPTRLDSSGVGRNCSSTQLNDQKGHSSRNETAHKGPGGRSSPPPCISVRMSACPGWCRSPQRTAETTQEAVPRRLGVRKESCARRQPDGCRNRPDQDTNTFKILYSFCNCGRGSIEFQPEPWLHTFAV